MKDFDVVADIEVEVVVEVVELKEDLSNLIGVVVMSEDCWDLIGVVDDFTNIFYNNPTKFL